MNLTKKQAYKLHYELWDWLYNNPNKHKWNWPKWEYNGGKVKTTQLDCFLCEIYGFKYQNECQGCPLDPFSYWNDWQEAKTPKTKKKYAKLIRDIVK